MNVLLSNKGYRLQVEGVLRDYTFTDLNLHDGSYYDIKLVSCNGAKLCSDSLLRNVLVDSSPPVAGRVKGDYTNRDTASISCYIFIIIT